MKLETHVKQIAILKKTHVKQIAIEKKITFPFKCTSCEFA